METTFDSKLDVRAGSTSRDNDVTSFFASLVQVRVLVPVLIRVDLDEVADEIIVLLRR